MVEHRQIDRRKQEELERKPHRQKKKTTATDDGLKARDDGRLSGLDWSASSSLESHAALLARIDSDNLRENLATHLQQSYGNAYVQRVIEHIQAEKGVGQPLEPGVRTEMEASFGNDFADVRVHTDAVADRLAHGLKAKAFTTGKDVFFKQDAYQPHSEVGKNLLAHELTHVVGQSINATTPGLQLKPNGDGGGEATTGVTQKPSEVSAIAPAQQQLSPADERTIKSKIDKEVARLPVPQIPSESQVKRVVDEGRSLGRGIEPLVKGKPAMAAFVQAEQEPQAQAKPKPELREEEAPAPKLKRKPELARMGARGERRGMRGAAVEMGGYVETTVSSTGEAMLAAGHGSRTALEVLGHVFGAIGAFFSTISAFLDIKALISTGKKLGALESVLHMARQEVQGTFVTLQEKRLLDAIEYAMHQKYQKFWTRALTLVGTLAATSAGIAFWAVGGIAAAALASNPVGWCIAGAILGIGVGLGIAAGLYKLGRALYKWWTGTKGKARADMAGRLFNHAVKEMTRLNFHAREAIRSLGLDPAQMTREYNQAKENEAKMIVERKCINLIARKLKSY